MSDPKQPDPVPHPPCSPDLTQSNFLSYLHMSEVLKRNRFANGEEGEALKRIKTHEFTDGSEPWEKRLGHDAASDGDSFEGD